MDFLQSSRVLLALMLATAGCAVGLMYVRRSVSPGRLLVALAIAYLGLQVGFALYAGAARWTYPGYLESLEGSGLQHLERLVDGDDLYPPPTSDYVAMTHNPGYYVMGAPFALVFGPDLRALRAPALISWLLMTVLVWISVRRLSGSTVAGLLAAGMYLSAYVAFDNHLDNGAGDASVLLLLLAGAMLADRGDRWSVLAASALWAMSFWIKETAAIPGLGGMLFLTWKLGLRQSVLPWGLFVVLAPFSYLVLGPVLFGPSFHYFTFSIRQGWLTSDITELTRLAKYLMRFLPVLSLLAWLGFFSELRDQRRNMSSVIALLPFAFLTGVIGCLDVGSSDIVFVYTGVWAIIVGMIALGRWLAAWDQDRWRGAIALGLMALSIGLLTPDPRDAMPPGEARAALVDLDQVAASFDGPIYWPMDGKPMVDANAAPTAAHWVALVDLVRGDNAAPTTLVPLDSLFAPLVQPDQTTYIFTRWPIEEDNLLREVATHYERIEDFDKRFESLQGLQHRWGAAYPRYVYRSLPVVAESPRIDGVTLDWCRQRLGVASVTPELLKVAAEKLPIGFYKDYTLLGVDAGDNLTYLPVIQYRSSDDSEASRAMISALWNTNQISKLPGTQLDDVLAVRELSGLERRLVDLYRGGYLPKDTTLLLGNEPGYRPNGDHRTPTQIVQDAELLEGIFQRNGMKLDLALGGISTPSTPYAIEAYGGINGFNFFEEILRQADGRVTFDAFVIHPYAADGKRPSANDSSRQIVRFRQIMKEHGYRNQPLIVGEVGVPFSTTEGVQPADRQYLTELIEYCLTATHPELGNPEDQLLMVQRVVWFLLAPPTEPYAGFSDDAALDLSRSALLAPDGNLTELGRAFEAAVSRICSTN